MVICIRKNVLLLLDNINILRMLMNYYSKNESDLTTYYNVGKLLRNAGKYC